MNSSLRRAARHALKPNAIILGVATCVFGWSLAEVMLPRGEFEHAGLRYWENLLLTSMMLAAAASLTTKRALADLLAATLSGPLTLAQAFIFFMIPARSEVTFLGVRHFKLWLDELAGTPASIWLMTGLSLAILCSATAATLGRTPPRP